MKPVHHRTDLYELSRAATALAVITAWNEIGALEALSGGPKTLEELPGDARALGITAQILAHVGLLMGSGQRWALSPAGRELYAAGSLGTYGGLNWFGDLSRLSTVLREGGPVTDGEGSSRATVGGVQPDNLEATRRFHDMLYRGAEISAGEVADLVAPRLPSGSRVLDLGGGHGRYARTFADRGFPATVLDLPLVVGLCRERHGDALSYIEGRFDAVDWGGPYHAVLQSNIVHGESPDDNARNTRMAWEALAPGGWLVFKDMFLESTGAYPPTAVFFGMTMLNYTVAGRSYRFDEARQWCRAAGFTHTEVVHHPEWALFLAQK